MKKLQIVTMACCVAAMSLTSCLNDSDDSTREMTKEEVAYCLNKVKGNYTGNLIYVAENVKDVKDKTDTLKINWTITTDSTMTIKNFPTRLLADNISDEKLKAALAEQPDQDIECRIGFINTSPVQYLINPKAPSYTVNHDGSNHKIQVAFYMNSTNSFGTYNETKKELYMQIIEGAIYMDEKQTSYLKTANPFAFEAKKE
ncbi:MAG: DUF4840 domain-containing protein [Prevotella sp.]|nr:DUF4840 domain-containing protein [Prevotella sp.]